MTNSLHDRFGLTLSPPEWTWQIEHTDPVMLLGSCFSDSIGERLEQHKFPTLVNPYGTLYHPHALAQCLRDLMNNRKYRKEDLVQNGEFWFSWNHHGKFNSINREETLECIHRAIESGHDFLQTSKLLIITFGTAWGYRLKSSGQMVANCHKVPSTQFEKRLYSPEQIQEDWTQVLADLKEFNPDLKLMFTISPIRYIRDGIVDNNRSKAALIQAAHKLIEENNNAHYFPSYEWIIDVLRDYRFFDKDRVHPSEEAITFIWEMLSKSLFAEPTQKLNRSIEQIHQGIGHRPQDSRSQEHQLFLKKLLNQTEQLQAQSGLDFSRELSRINERQ